MLLQGHNGIYVVTQQQFEIIDFYDKKNIFISSLCLNIIQTYKGNKYISLEVTKSKGFVKKYKEPYLNPIGVSPSSTS